MAHGNRTKRKRKQSVDKEEEYSGEKKPNLTFDSSAVKNHLDLILILNRNDVSLERKIELVYEFVLNEVDRGGSSGNKQWPVNFSRLVCYLCEWIQSALISTEHKNDELVCDLDPCLDYRTWAIFRFCLQNSASAVSTKLLEVFARISKVCLLKSPKPAGSSSELGNQNKLNDLFELVSECLCLILASNSGAFYNADINLWASSARKIICFSRKVVSKSEGVDGLLAFSFQILKHFASYLWFHPDLMNANRKRGKIFRTFVKKILEPSLELFVLLKSNSGAGRWESISSLLSIVEEILLNSLFHPVHVGGFLNAKNRGIKQNGFKSKQIKGSYHRLLFSKLDELVARESTKALGGVGYLLPMLVSRVKSQRSVSFSSKFDLAPGKGGEESEEIEITSKLLFEVSEHFLDPLLCECKRFGEEGFLKPGELLRAKLVKAHSILKSVNETLSTIIKEKIYIRTEDTSEVTHFNFLKGAYDMVISFSEKVCLLWLSALDKDDASIKKMLPLAAKEIFVTLSHILEIEYGVFGEDLTQDWSIVLSFLAVHGSSVDGDSSSFLTAEVLEFSCKLINVHSELRQVSSVLFALCKAMRLFAFSPVYISSNLCSIACLKALTTLLSSQKFQLAISDAIKSIREGQASGCLQQLNADVSDSLEWVRSCDSGTDTLKLLKKEHSSHGMPDFILQYDIFGVFLCEIYTIVLNSLVVTSPKSILVGIENLVNTLKPSFTILLSCHTRKNLEEFIFSVTGREIPVYEMAGIDTAMKLESIASVFVFFFRLYSSCRSLYRKSVSFMSPDFAKKASEKLGSLLTVCHGLEWEDNIEFIDEGYFSWIVKPSISIVDVFRTFYNNFLLQKSATFARVVYILHAMALERLKELNWKLNTLKFLQEKCTLSIHTHLLEHNGMHKLTRQLKGQFSATYEEAKELANFMTGGLALLEDDATSMTKGVLSWCENTWDLSICSLTVESFHTAIWLLLCQNTDIWCIHADKKLLEKFIANLLHSWACASNSMLASSKQNSFACNHEISKDQISLELLSDPLFWEHSVLGELLPSKICSSLKHSLLDVFHSCAKSIKFDSLPELREALGLLTLSPVDYYFPDVLVSPSENVAASAGTSHSEDNSRGRFPSVSSVYRTCKSLLGLLCQMPGAHVNAESLRTYATCVINIERLLISVLSNNRCESFMNCPFELLDLFLTCRRTLKCLVMASYKENPGVMDSPPFSSVFDTSFTMTWLLESVMEIAGLLLAFTGEKVRLMTFRLMHHTSQIFLIVSEGSMLSTISSILCDEKLLRKVHDGPKKKVPLSDYTALLQTFKTWRRLEDMAEMLNKHTHNLLVNLKGNCQSTEIGSGPNGLKWSSLSSVISCIQGFLQGLDVAIEPMYDLPSKLIYASSKFCECISLFEHCINFCLNMLLKDHTQDTKKITTTESFDAVKSNGRSLSLRNHSVNEKTGDCSNCFSCHDKEGKETPGNGYTSNNSRSSLHACNATRIIRWLNKIDICNSGNSNVNLLQNLMVVERTHTAFTLRQLFTAAGSILKMKCRRWKHSYKMLLNDNKFGSNPLDAIKTSCLVLSQSAETVETLDWSSFIWLDGIIKYVEVVEIFLNSADPELSENLYSHLLDAHLRAVGKSISVEGRTATLFSHEVKSKTRNIEYEEGPDDADSPILGKYDLEAFRAKLRGSFKNLVRTASELHLEVAINAVVRALIGFQESCTVVYKISTGDSNGGNVSLLVAAGIYCLDAVLEIVSGRKPIMKQNISLLNSALFNIILHAQNPSIFYLEKPSVNRSNVNPDPGAVILMCVEVLTKVIGDHAYDELDPLHVSQCLHIPASLFQCFNELRVCRGLIGFVEKLNEPHVRSLMDAHACVIDSHYSVDLYAACCKLMSTTLKHRKSETTNCVALLEDSVNILLKCFESLDANLVSKGYFTWDLDKALRCAGFFRRIYEEIRHQKDTFGRHAAKFLSSYISMYAGYGPRKTGIKREIDEVLRPGIYSLIDVCTRDDLQLLHTVLGDGSCRNTLATLQHDYKLYFQFKGKV